MPFTYCTGFTELTCWEVWLWKERWPDYLTDDGVRAFEEAERTMWSSSDDMRGWYAKMQQPITTVVPKAYFAQAAIGLMPAGCVRGYGTYEAYYLMFLDTLLRLDCLEFFVRRYYAEQFFG